MALSLKPQVISNKHLGTLIKLVAANSAIPDYISSLIASKLSDEETIQACSLIEDHTCPFRTVNLKELSKSNARSIIEAIGRNKKSKITTLSLQKCSIDNEVAGILAKVIENNTSLQELNLNFNNIGGIGLESLNLAIRNNFFLHTVHIMKNPCLLYDNKGKNGQIVTLDTYKYAKRNRDNNDFSSLYGNAMKAGKTARWGRSKLMVIGQGGAGKTSTVRSLLNLPFNDKWDSTIGAALTKTNTTNWQEGNINDSDFNHVAAKIFQEARDLMVEEAKRKEMEDEAIRQHKLEEMKKKQADETRETVDFKKMKPVFPAFGVGKTKKQEKSKAKASEPKYKAALVEKSSKTQQENAVSVQFAVDALPADPESFKAADPDRSLLDANEVARRYGQRMIANAVENDVEEEDKVTFTIWDYGGQKVFYTLHHLFLTQYGVYLLAFDVCELIQVRESGKKQFLEVNPEAIEYLEFWVNSVMLHAPDAPLIIAGTHIDKIPENVSKEEFFKEADAALTDIVKVEKHQNLVKNDEENLCFFPVDNRQRGKSVVSLRQTIENSVAGKFYVEQKVPLRWVFLCDTLVDDPDFKNDSWHDLSKVVDLGAQFDIPPHEIVQMLKLFNQLGVMVYLDATNGLQNRVVTDPQWLINNLGLVIRDDMHGMPSQVLNEMKHHWEFARETGIVSEPLLHILWSDKSQNEAQNEDTIVFLIDLMRNSMLLSDWDYSIIEAFKSKMRKNHKYFLVPSLIPENIRVTQAFIKDVEDNGKCSIILDFSRFFLPTGVFQRFVCLLLLMFKSFSEIKSGKGSKKKKKEKKKPNVDSKIPFLGPDFARFLFEKANVFDTTLYMSAFEKDSIKISVANEKYAPKLIQTVNAIIKKIKSEVMGGQLHIEVLVSNLKTMKPVQKKVENAVVDAENLAEELKFVSIDEAKAEEEYKVWFHEEETRTKDVADNIDFDMLFG